MLSGKRCLAMCANPCFASPQTRMYRHTQVRASHIYVHSSNGLTACPGPACVSTFSLPHERAWEAKVSQRHRQRIMCLECSVPLQLASNRLQYEELSPIVPQSSIRNLQTG